MPNGTGGLLTTPARCIVTEQARVCVINAVWTKTSIA